MSLPTWLVSLFLSWCPLDVPLNETVLYHSQFMSVWPSPQGGDHSVRLSLSLEQDGVSGETCCLIDHFEAEVSMNNIKGVFGPIFWTITRICYRSFNYPTIAGKSNKVHSFHHSSAFHAHLSLQPYHKYDLTVLNVDCFVSTHCSLYFMSNRYFSVWLYKMCFYTSVKTNWKCINPKCRSHTQQK